MSDYPHTCKCGSPCYEGAMSIECTNVHCQHYKSPLLGQRGETFLDPSESRQDNNLRKWDEHIDAAKIATFLEISKKVEAAVHLWADLVEKRSLKQSDVPCTRCLKPIQNPRDDFQCECGSRQCISNPKSEIYCLLRDATRAEVIRRKPPYHRSWLAES